MLQLSTDKGAFIYSILSIFARFHRHIPKAKATTIAETPELKRIAENTKLQSNVKYHAEFEKAKGKLTQVSRAAALRWILFTARTLDRLLTIPRPSESSRTRRTSRTSLTMATSRRKPRWNDNAKTLKSSTIEVGWLFRDEIKSSDGKIWWIISCLPPFPSCTTLFMAVYHPNICNEAFLPFLCCIRGVVAKTESYEIRSPMDLVQALTTKSLKLLVYDLIENFPGYQSCGKVLKLCTS